MLLLEIQLDGCCLQLDKTALLVDLVDTFEWAVTASVGTLTVRMYRLNFEWSPNILHFDE